MGNSHQSVKQAGMDMAHLYKLCVRTNRSIKTGDFLVKYKQKRTPKARKMEGICPSITALCSIFNSQYNTSVALTSAAFGQLFYPKPHVMTGVLDLNL